MDLKFNNSDLKTTYIAFLSILLESAIEARNNTEVMGRIIQKLLHIFGFFRHILNILMRNLEIFNLHW